MRKWGDARRWIPYSEFEHRMHESSRIVRERGWSVTVPALAEVSGLNDKRIRSRLNYHPQLKSELGVVSSSVVGRYAAAERRRVHPVSIGQAKKTAFADR
jgi:hypothetical protein